MDPMISDSTFYSERRRYDSTIGNKIKFLKRSNAFFNSSEINGFSVDHSAYSSTPSWIIGDFANDRGGGGHISPKNTE